MDQVQRILGKQLQVGVNFLVVEPAKGEYKNVFGHDANVSVFGTNPDYTELLRINPFRFPKGVHVLEHVDRLIEWIPSQRCAWKDCSGPV